MTPDEKIAAFLGEARPATTAPAFNAQVMERVARRELALSLMTAAGVAIVGGILLWALLPVLSAILGPASDTLMAGAGMVVAVLGLVALAQRQLHPFEAS